MVPDTTMPFACQNAPSLPARKRIYSGPTTSRSADGQRRPPVEDVRVESGGALVRARDLQQLRLADDRVETRESVRGTLLDDIHASLRPDLPVCLHDRGRGGPG